VKFNHSYLRRFSSFSFQLLTKTEPTISPTILPEYLTCNFSSEKRISLALKQITAGKLKSQLAKLKRNRVRSKESSADRIILPLAAEEPEEDNSPVCFAVVSESVIEEKE